MAGQRRGRRSRRRRSPPLSENFNFTRLSFFIRKTPFAPAVIIIIAPVLVGDSVCRFVGHLRDALNVRVGSKQVDKGKMMDPWLNSSVTHSKSLLLGNGKLEWRIEKSFCNPTTLHMKELPPNSLPSLTYWNCFFFLLESPDRFQLKMLLYNVNFLALLTLSPSPPLLVLYVSCQRASECILLESE